RRKVSDFFTVIGISGREETVLGLGSLSLGHAVSFLRSSRRIPDPSWGTGMEQRTTAAAHPGSCSLCFWIEHVNRTCQPALQTVDQPSNQDSDKCGRHHR